MILVLMSSLATFFGGLIIRASTDRTKAALTITIGITAGFLLSLGFLSLMPEALSSEVGGLSNLKWIVLGSLLLFFIEHIISPHFHLGDSSQSLSPSNALIFLLALSIHSLMDGITLAVARNAGIYLGFVVALGLILHRLIEGMSLATVLKQAKYKEEYVLFAPLLLSVSFILGYFGVHFLQLPVGPLLGFICGVTIYVGATEMLPELRHADRFIALISILTGVGLYYISTIIGKFFFWITHTNL